MGCLILGIGLRFRGRDHCPLIAIHGCPKVDSLTDRCNH